MCKKRRTPSLNQQELTNDVTRDDTPVSNNQTLNLCKDKTPYQDERVNIEFQKGDVLVAERFPHKMKGEVGQLQQRQEAIINAGGDNIPIVRSRIVNNDLSHFNRTYEVAIEPAAENIQNNKHIGLHEEDHNRGSKSECKLVLFEDIKNVCKQIKYNKQQRVNSDKEEQADRKKFKYKRGIQNPSSSKAYRRRIKS